MTEMTKAKLDKHTLQRYGSLHTPSRWSTEQTQMNDSALKEVNILLN